MLSDERPSVRITSAAALHDPLAGGPALRGQRLVVGLVGKGHGVRLPAGRLIVG